MYVCAIKQNCIHPLIKREMIFIIFKIKAAYNGYQYDISGKKYNIVIWPLKNVVTFL